MRNALHFLHILLLSALLCLAPVFPVFPTGRGDAGSLAHAAARRDVNVRSAIVVDVKTGRVLFEQNADARIPPASLTKIMSMLVALDKVSARKVSLKDKVRVSRAAAQQGGSKMHIRQGELVTLDELLMGMAVSSGNDASVAVAEHVAGSSAAFVRLMNAEARRLGMKNSSFKNPNGLPAPGQYTSARDMSRLARYYLKMYPNALRYHRTRRLTHNGRTTTNKNPLLGTCPGADGLKTGWITASGYNIISTAERNGVRLLVVALGARTPAIRSTEIRRLVEAGFEAQKRGISVAAALRGSGGSEKSLASSTPKTASKNRPAAAKSTKAKSGQKKAATQQRRAKTTTRAGKAASTTSKSNARGKAQGSTQAKGSTTPAKTTAQAKTPARTKAAAPAKTATQAKATPQTKSTAQAKATPAAGSSKNVKPLANSVKARAAAQQTGQNNTGSLDKARADASRNLNL